MLSFFWDTWIIGYLTTPYELHQSFKDDSSRSVNVDQKGRDIFPRYGSDFIRSQ